MKLKVIENHIGEGQFPMFIKGTQVNNLQPCAVYPNWFSCEIEGYKTYVPSHFVENNTLLVDYNPTEIDIEANELVELLELHYQWAVVSYKDAIGWLPVEKLRTEELFK